MSRRMMLAVACLGFFAIGWLGASIGPALDDLAEQTGSDLAAIGTLFTASLVGGLATQLVAGPAMDRFGQRPVLLTGGVLLAVGVAGVALSPALPLTLAAGVVWGLGFGALDVGFNVLIAEVYADQSVKIVNLLHVFFGAGAVASPAFASLTLNRADTAIPGIWAGALILLVMLAFAARLPRGHVTGARPDTPAAHAPFSYRVPLLWGIGLLLMIYVGVEIGLGGWTPDYTERTTTLSTEAATLMASGFWLALSAGRIAASLAGDRLSAGQVMWLCVVGSAAGGVLMALGTGFTVPTIIAILLMGFSFGPVFPTMVVVITNTFRNGPGKATSVGVALGSLGGATIPALQGYLLERVSPASSAILIAVSTVGMLALWLLIRGGVRASAAPASAAAGTNAGADSVAAASD